MPRRVSHSLMNNEEAIQLEGNYGIVHGAFGPFTDFYFTNLGILVVPMVSPIYSLLAMALWLVLPGAIAIAEPNASATVAMVSWLGLLLLILSASASYLTARIRRSRLEGRMPGDLDWKGAKLIRWSNVQSLRVGFWGMLYFHSGREHHGMRVRKADVDKIQFFAAERAPEKNSGLVGVDMVVPTWHHLFHGLGGF